MKNFFSSKNETMINVNVNVQNQLTGVLVK